MGHLGISVTVLHEDTSTPTNFYKLWFYLHFLKSFCVNLLRLVNFSLRDHPSTVITFLRLTLISLVLERSVATTFRQCYESHRGFILTPLILSALSYSFAFILTSMENVCKFCYLFVFVFSILQEIVKVCYTSCVFPALFFWLLILVAN